MSAKKDGGAERIKLRRAVVVEGKYDKIKLESLADAVIITTEGFGVFKNAEKLELIRSYARRTGIIILTDSDDAGRLIRGYIKGAVPESEYDIVNIYVPTVSGKEKRKRTPGKAGLVGVEGIDSDLLRRLLIAADRVKTCTVTEGNANRQWLTRSRLYEDGFFGGKDSARKRKKLLEEFSLPENLGVSALIDALNILAGEAEYNSFLSNNIE
ncbi:MAG: DUF4093 domain-containing protein [Oscillospiraceae bacterium]|nr:DUF4093 domain-containing protein [Oscillospiraceae bacterium]